MVLFSLTLLLLVLMVLGTIGIGVRAKQRVELQMVADSAAYSEAVVTARTFNAISVLNRTQIAYMVVMAGTQSMISHSTLYYDALHSGTACSGHGGPKLPPQFSQLNWSKADYAAGKQVLAMQGACGTVKTAEMSMYQKLIQKDLVGQKLVKQIARAAFPSAGSEIMVPASGAEKSLKEINGGAGLLSESTIRINENNANAVGSCSTGAVCQSTNDLHQEIMATYGSEGWTFVRDRAGGMSKFTGTTGSLGFAMGDAPSTADDAATSSAYDTGVPMAVLCNDGTFGTGTGGDTWVNSTQSQDLKDEHHYGPTADFLGPVPETGAGYNGKTVSGPGGGNADGIHTLGECNVCDGIWVGFVGWNQSRVDAMGNPSKNDYGQPKLYAVIARDLAKTPPDPWNLFFKFHFKRGDTGAVFDNAAKTGGIGLSQQVALSSSIVYYHRPYERNRAWSWVEPPNFLNPFWRATLISSEGASDDEPVQFLRDRGFGPQGRALSKLEAAGFKGGGTHP